MAAEFSIVLSGCWVLTGTFRRWTPKLPSPWAQWTLTTHWENEFSCAWTNPVGVSECLSCRWWWWHLCQSSPLVGAGGCVRKWAAFKYQFTRANQKTAFPSCGKLRYFDTEMRCWNLQIFIEMKCSDSEIIKTGGFHRNQEIQEWPFWIQFSAQQGGRAEVGGPTHANKIIPKRA